MRTRTHYHDRRGQMCEGIDYDGGTAWRCQHPALVWNGLWACKRHWQERRARDLDYEQVCLTLPCAVHIRYLQNAWRLGASFDGVGRATAPAE